MKDLAEPGSARSPWATGPLLDGATVVLTGAAGGIGRSVAAVLAGAGARLALVDRDSASLAGLEATLDGAGDRHFATVTDTADTGAVRALDAEVAERLGPVDVLVNCAGVWAPLPYDAVDDDAWEATIDGNLRNAWTTCRAILPGMIERGAGSVVNFASTAGEYGSISPAAHYAAAKGGVIGLTKSLAREAGPHGVRVNAVSPGPTDTVALGAATPEQRASVAARTLLNRLGRPEEIAGGVLFLASPLSGFVTGHILRVNGGSLL
jgi:NAD(P)-dependent dehydrogenase (short-subunit alcohol dehydrogenase family)